MKIEMLKKAEFSRTSYWKYSLISIPCVELHLVCVDGLGFKKGFHFFKKYVCL
jgi:hypothetical protein